MTGAYPDIRTLRRPCQSVDQDHERVLGGFPRPLQRGEQHVAASVLHGKLDPLRRGCFKRGTAAHQHVSQRLQVAAPPRPAAAELGKAYVRASHEPTISIWSGTMSEGAWPMAGNSTSSAFAAMALAVSGSRRSDSAPRSRSTGQRTFSQTDAR